MKIIKTVGCMLMTLFLLFTPKYLTKNAQREYVDTRFLREHEQYAGTAVLYHIVRHRPYLGSLTSWLQKQAAAFENAHKGVYITVEGMDEDAFYERLEYGRRGDAYSFFSGSLYEDLLKPFETPDLTLRDGLFRTALAVPYCYSGYCLLKKEPTGSEASFFCADDILAARLGRGENTAPEETADTLYTDLRRAGDLIRYRDGFALAELQASDRFTDAVCWLGIDRDADEEKTAVIRMFFLWLLETERQGTLCSLGLLSVRADVRNEPPEPALKDVFRAYESIQTVDPFRWYAERDALRDDAALTRKGDGDAALRFTKRLQELIG